MLRFVVDVEDLPLALGVESAKTLASGSAGSLLEVGGETPPACIDTSHDLVLLVDSLSALGGLRPLIELLEGVHEAVADAVLLVGSQGLLNYRVAEHVSLSEVLGHNAVEC